MQWIEPQPLDIPDRMRQVISTEGDLGALVAGLLVRHIVDESEAQKMVRAFAYDLAKTTYRL